MKLIKVYIYIVSIVYIKLDKIMVVDFWINFFQGTWDEARTIKYKKTENIKELFAFFIGMYIYIYIFRVVSRIWMQLLFFANDLFWAQVTISAWNTQPTLLSELFLQLTSREESKALYIIVTCISYNRRWLGYKV